MPSSFEPLFGGLAASAPAPAAPAWMAAAATPAAKGGFTADMRFLGAAIAEEPEPDLVASAELEAAYAEGERAGRAAAAEEQAQRERARAGLALELARLDEQLGEQLAIRLAQTVATLCEATMAPFAIDPESLQRRCIAAALLVGEGITDASLRLNPADIDLLDPGFASTWHILPDPVLERGTVVFDTAEGAVIDGPGQWRAALAEALGTA